MRNIGTARQGWRSAMAGRGRPAMATALAAAAALLFAACTGTPTQRASSGKPAAPHLPAAILAVTPANGSTDASPAQGVTVTAVNGVIRSVRVTRGSDPVGGSYGDGYTVWRSTWALQPSASYRVTATAVNAAGQTVTRTSAFRTLAPSSTLQVQTFEASGATYGVGMPIILTFSQPVTYKAAVERSLQVWTSKPVVGAWYWDGNESLVFRPRTYWPQNTSVRFVAHLDGVEAAPGVYGTANLSQSFRIGSSLIAVVSTTSHYAKIYYQGKLFGVWPVSTGAPGDDTANGTYLTIDKHNPTLMSGPGYTDFPVPYAVRFTWSGNYMHDAYWSVAQQGYTNVSHGCVNLSPAHAEVYYNLAVPGDPVTVTGSPVAGAWDDGWTEWFLTWQQFLRGSATHDAVAAGPWGSTFVDPGTLPSVTASAPLHDSLPGNSRAQ